MATEFSDETDASRFTMRVDGELVGVLDYRVLGGAISLTRAFTVPHRRGHGYAAQLVDFAVGEIERGGELTVVPMCWYVAEWFDAHPERAGVLQRTAG